MTEEDFLICYRGKGFRLAERVRCITKGEKFKLNASARNCKSERL